MIAKALRRYTSAYPRAFVCVCSLLLSSAFFLLTPSSHVSTVATDYEYQVNNLREGRGLTDPDGHVLTRTPPVYPLTLAAIRFASTASGIGEPLLLFEFAALCLAVASVCTYNLAALVVGRERAWVAAALFAVHPHVLFGLITPLSETPFLPALYGAVWLFVDALTANARHRSTLMFLAGALCGAALLIRPAGLFVPAILAAVVVIVGRMTLLNRLRCSTLLIAGVVLIVLPWEGYVWRQSGELVLVSSNGVGTIRDGFAFHKTRRSPIWIPPKAERVVQDVWEAYGDLTNYSSVMRLIVSQARHNPVGLTELYAYKVIRSWYGVDTQQPLKEIVNMLASALYMIPAAFGIRRYFRGGTVQHTQGGMVLLLLILYFWGITTLTVSIARYMVPTIGFACVFIPLCVSHRRFASWQAAPDPALAAWELAR